MTDALAANPVGRALGVALVQFLWQGAAIGLATALLLTVFRRASAQTTYIVAGTGLLVMMIAPAATLTRVLRESPASVAIAVPVAAGSGVVGAGVPVETARGLNTIAQAVARPAISGWAAWSRSAEPYFPGIVAIWAIGVLLSSARLLATWLLVERIRRRSNRPWTQADAWRQRVQTMSRALRVTKPVRMVESSLVAVPTVIGWIRPMILLPASAFAGLSPSQLEAVIAHELAHIGRYDYLVNLLQNVVETLLFFHPAVWWLSRRIRIEREHCCDDLAVAVCGDRMAYADALTSLAELRAGEMVLGMAATGGDLVERIRRLIERPDIERRSPAWLIGGLVVLTVFAASMRGVAKDRAPVPAAAKTSVPAPKTPIAADAVVMPAAAFVEAAPPARHVVPVADQARQSAVPVAATQREQVLAAEKAFRQARLENNVEGLSSILDDNYLGMNQDGHPYNKAEELEHWKTFKVLSLEEVAFVQFSADTALDTGSMTEVDAAGTDRMFFTRVWRRSGEAWRLLSATQFRDPNAAQMPQTPQTLEELNHNVNTGFSMALDMLVQMHSPGVVSERWATYPGDTTPGVASPPKILRHVSPSYPQVAVAAGIEGSSTLEFTIDLNGDVVDAKFVQHVPLFDQASLDAIRQWKFVPASVDGRLRPVRVSLTFDFTLRK